MRQAGLAGVNIAQPTVSIKGHSQFIKCQFLHREAVRVCYMLDYIGVTFSKMTFTLTNWFVNWFENQELFGTSLFVYGFEEK